MFAYLILCSTNGDPIDADVILRFEEEPPELPMHPESRLVWSNPQYSCVVLGWQAFTDLEGIGSHWEEDERGLTAFAGHCWPKNAGWDHVSGQSWAAQLRAYLESADPIDSREDLYGQFSLVSLEADGSGIAATDFSSLSPVFMAHGPGFTVISNRSGLCARAITPTGAPLQRSLTGIGWLLCIGEMFFDGDTGYWDVERIPLGAHLEIDPKRGVTVVEPERCPLGPQGQTATYEEVLSAVEQDLRQSIRQIAALPVDNRKVGLSGGFDSRVLTALIIDEGLQDRFRFWTFGSPERPDTIVANQIATRYRLDWELDDRNQRTSDEMHAEVLNHTAIAEGIVNGWDSVGAVIYEAGVSIRGFGGEYLRWEPMSRAGVAVSNEAEMLALIRRYIDYDSMQILLPEVLEYYHRSVEQWAKMMLARGEAPNQVPSYIRQTTMERHIFGILQAWGAQSTLLPFMTPIIVRSNQLFPPAERPSPRLQLDLTRRFHTELSKMPYAYSTWPEQAIAHLPDADDYRSVAPLPIVTPAGQNWRQFRHHEYLSFMKPYILDRSNPIHRFVKSDRLERLLPTGVDHPGRTRRIWAVLTAAIWAGRHESEVRIGRAASVSQMVREVGKTDMPSRSVSVSL